MEPWNEGQLVKDGGTEFVTFTKYWQVSELPARSVAVYSTVETPSLKVTSKVLPETTGVAAKVVAPLMVSVYVSMPGKVQESELSVTVGCVMVCATVHISGLATKGTSAVTQFENTGFWLSSTVTVMVQVEVLPLASVTLKLTGFVVPISKRQKSEPGGKFPPGGP